MDVISRANPDVVIMQEFIPSKSFNDLRPLLAAAGWHVRYAGDVAIAAREPLTVIETFPLQTSSSRRALHVRLPQRSLNVIGVHFATRVATNQYPRLQSAAKSRVLQVATLLAYAPATRTIIAGDFNLPPRGLAFRRLTSRYRDTFSCGLGLGYTYRSDLPVLRIDHILTSPDLHPITWRTIKSNASDHRAVVAEITW